MKKRKGSGHLMKTTISEFYCVECGKKGIPIARKLGAQREAGHLKSLWCVYCQKQTNHAEIRPFGTYTVENFKEEFELGRFVNGHKYPIADLIDCTKIECPYNKDGKCWNSNDSYKCGHKPYNHDVVLLPNGKMKVEDRI